MRCQMASLVQRQMASAQSWGGSALNQLKHPPTGVILLMATRTPARKPVEVGSFIPLFTGNFAFQVVQEFFHQHMLMVVSESGKSEMLKDRGHAVSGVQYWDFRNRLNFWIQARAIGQLGGGGGRQLAANGWHYPTRWAGCLVFLWFRSWSSDSTWFTWKFEVAEAEQHHPRSRASCIMLYWYEFWEKIE